MNLGKIVTVQSFPRVEDFVLRAGIITLDHEDGTVDVCAFNSATDIREASMPLHQSLQNIPLLQADSPAPEGFRGRWIAVLSTPDSAPSLARPAKPKKL